MRDDTPRKTCIRFSVCPIDRERTIGSHHRSAAVETILRDRSYVEVAEELEIPAATVRTRVHYALRHLRCVLGADRDR